MSGARLEGLQVLVTGIASLSSRDVMRELLVEGAQVTAVDCDDQVLRGLQRDLGLYLTTVDVAAIDLFSRSEMRLFEDNLRGLGQLPHLIVCCCEAGPCPAALATSLLQPSLVLHALPRTGTRLEHALLSLRIASLPALIEQARRNRDFDAHTQPKPVSIAGHVFGLHRGEAPFGRSPRRREIATPERMTRPAGHSSRLGSPRKDFMAAAHPAPPRQDARESQ